VSKTRDNYNVTGETVADLKRAMNFLMQRLADRMDRIEGIRGDASIEGPLDMNSNRIVDLAAAVDDTDALRKTQADLTGPSPTLSSLTITPGDLSAHGNFYVYDSSGNLIHSME
jgi:hypothetical protein